MVNDFQYGYNLLQISFRIDPVFSFLCAWSGAMWIWYGGRPWLEGVDMDLSQTLWFHTQVVVWPALDSY